MGSLHHEIVVGLQVDPELRSRVEGLGEKPSGLRGDPPLPTNDLVDPLDRDREVRGQGYLSQSQRLQELIPQNLARVGRNSVLWKHSLTLQPRW